ncbi:hypothetical protein F0562_023726 [Nyssa sinensis]|uniref:F-box domain-containing protein n=1 Tax=Nyssa sinensis TaxID=561372 RepID=A0A5J5BIM8_9ASTE|nr:hypothetical protein F0562_023726 [Nyssa sinensis]
MVDSKGRRLTRCNGQESTEVVDLPLEIISDILARLPIESIMTCRIVCKSWYSLTEDPDFINLQLSRSNYQPARVILYNYTLNHLLLLDTEEHKNKWIPFQNMLFEGHLVYRHVMCSCNGLLCIASDFKLDPVFIYNPMTRKHVILPSSDSKLDFQDQKVGLGFDPSTGTYKVVRLYKDESEASRFEILSLGESSWKELSAPHNYDKFSILAFDLIEEKFQIIALPKEFPSDGLPYFDFQDLDGYLTFVEHDSDLMKMWRLTGEKVGDFSLCLERTYDTHVRWNDWLGYGMIGGLNRNDYLLKVWFYEGLHRKTHVTQVFSPNGTVCACGHPRHSC